ncbi:hypothetical protein SBADM41S_09706 [Streptomyces badius]
MQALPGHKMASAGADWQADPGRPDQVGPRLHGQALPLPCGAWSFWQANNWY